MPTACCVIGCKSRGHAQPGVVFFQLPLTNPPVLTQWLIVLDRRDWVPKASSRICSLHFAPDDYIAKPNQSGTERLKPDAIPSVFPDLGSDDDDDDDEASLEQMEKAEESPKPTGKSKLTTTSKPRKPTPISTPSKPTPISTPRKHTPVSTPIVEPTSGRPRRISKVSSKMKDYILLDDIKKNRNFLTASQKTVPVQQDVEHKAAQELLSILEDSNSISEDESNMLSSKPGTSSGIKLDSNKVLKMKPAPASVKRAKQLELAGKSVTKGKVSPNPPNGKNESRLACLEKLPPELKQKYFHVKQGEKVLYLTYADLNPIADMTKNNVLFDDVSSISSLDLCKSIENENLDMDSDICNSSPLPEDPPKIETSIVETPLKRKKQKKPVTNVNKVVDINENKTVDDDETLEVETKHIIDNTDISPPIIPNVSKNLKAASSVKKRKKRVIAEILVRTDESGSIIEKMTHLENTETPKKRNKMSQKQMPHMLNTFVPAANSEEQNIHQFSQRISDAVKRMRISDKGKINTASLTVLITTLPPMKENERVVLQKKNVETNAEETHELKVVYSSHNSVTEGKKVPEGEIPIIGACELESDKVVGEKDKSVPGDKEDVTSDKSTTSGKVVTFNSATTSVNHIDREVPDGADLNTSAPLQHDHTYISPNTIAGEGETDGDEHSREGTTKLNKLSEEEIAYRNKVHKKLRLLKETVKRKNEYVGKLKQKVQFIEKALRDERKNKKRMRPGFDTSLYESMLDDEVTKSMEFSMQSGNLPLDFDENLEDSDEDGRPSRSPITYICEPAIDVCEKPSEQE